MNKASEPGKFGYAETQRNRVVEKYPMTPILQTVLKSLSFCIGCDPRERKSLRAALFMGSPRAKSACRQLSISILAMSILGGCTLREYRATLVSAGSIADQYGGLVRTQVSAKINESASNLRMLKAKTHPSADWGDSRSAHAYFSETALGNRLSVVRSLSAYLYFLEQLSTHGSKKHLPRIEATFHQQLQKTLGNLHQTDPNDSGQLPEVRSAVQGIVAVLDAGEWRDRKDLVSVSIFFSVPVENLLHALAQDAHAIVARQEDWAKAVKTASERYARALGREAGSNRWEPRSSWDLNDPTYAERLTLERNLAALEMNRRFLIQLTECAQRGQGALNGINDSSTRFFAEFRRFNTALVDFARSQRSSNDLETLHVRLSALKSALGDLETSYANAVVDTCRG